MIIHPNEILQGIETKEKLIDLVIPQDFTLLLKKVSNSISELNSKSTDAAIRDQSFEVERDIHTAIIFEKTNGQPLFDLATVGYTNVKTETIKYLYSPKNEVVNNYVVDVLTTYFEYEDDKNDYQVLLPMYLIHEGHNVFLLPIQGENEVVQASLEKFKN